MSKFDIINEFLYSEYNKVIKCMSVKRAILYIAFKCLSKLKVNSVEDLKEGDKVYLETDNNMFKVYIILDSVKESSIDGTNLYKFVLHFQYGLNDYIACNIRIDKDYKVYGNIFYFEDSDLIDPNKNTIPEDKEFIVNATLANYVNSNLEGDRSNDLYYSIIVDENGGD
jgi:hypothetical protein